MASGTLGAEEAREKPPRWSENSKVYTRKIRNKAATNDNNQNTATAIAANDATITTATNNNENGTVQKDVSTLNVNGNATTTDNVAQTPALQPPEAEEANSHQQKQPNSPRIEVISGDTSRLNPPEAEDANSHQHQQPNSPRIEVISGDTSSLNRQEGGLMNDHDGNIGKESTLVRPVVTLLDDSKVRISFSAARSKCERRELKRKLVSELEEIKSLAEKLQHKEAQLSRYNGELSQLATGNVVLGGQIHSQYSTSDGLGQNGGLRVFSEVGSARFYDSRPFHHLSVNTRHVVEILEKEKRTPKANQYYRSSDFVYGTGKIVPAQSNKKLKAAHRSKKKGGGSVTDKQIFKKCGSLLTKLMKHQYGWVFNTPVDVKKMGLHDYYDIIKHPMDLGLVKSRLSKNWYKSPLEFAEDVRLTFRNAMTYNPEGQDVHVMALELSNMFEERWVDIEAEYSSKLRFEAAYDMGSRRARFPTYVSPHPPMVSALPVPPPPVYQETRHLDRSESFAQPVESRQKPVYNPPVVRAPSLKKPKAKDPNKRVMTFEEKQKLSSNLQALPSEKLDSIVQIIKKRNSTLSQHDDEIEVDIDSVDAETLWELDRFVTNYKKSLSKHKRKAELARQRAEAQQAMQAQQEVHQETRADDTNAISRSSPVHERKEADNASGSSSSGSSSSDSGSSSSDSDSDSSSGSESNGG